MQVSGGCSSSSSKQIEGVLGARKGAMREGRSFLIWACRQSVPRHIMVVTICVLELRAGSTTHMLHLAGGAGGLSCLLMSLMGGCRQKGACKRSQEEQFAMNSSNSKTYTGYQS